MNNNTAILSAAYFGPVQYFAKFLQYKTIIIEQHENYIKQSYRNRCDIYGANGKLTLSIPIVKNHNIKTPIKELKIAYHTNWIKLHLKSIESAYRSAPFYEYYVDDIFELIQSEPEYLFEFNLQIIQKIITLIEIETTISLSEEYNKNVTFDDYRQLIHPKISYKHKDKLFQATKYYQVFEQKHGFISNLSVIDLLFNAGPEAYSVLKQCIIA